MAWKYQTGATELSFSGYYQDVLHTWDKNGLRKPNTTVEDSLYFVNTKKLNAKDYILEQSKNTDIIIINEAHHMAQHRMFTKSLLKDLYANGYRYLGLEALFETTINYRKYPVIESGYYTKELEFGNLIAEALKLGFTLFNYEATPGKNGKEREIEQTESHIKTSHNFNTEYANKSSTPHWDVVVFDEAQRFISSAKMKDYFGVNISEHEFIMDVFSSKKHCMLIILIGEHQEIGWGETSDTYVWNQVFEKRKDKWTVYGSEILIKEFDKRIDIEFIAKDCLDLKVSFRQIKTPEYPVFVNKLLDYKGDFQTEEFKALKQTYASISENGFEFFITRNLDKAIEYCENRYNNQPNSYCTFSSSESDYDWNELEQDVESIIVNDYNISSKFKINEHFKNNGNNSSKEAVFYPLTEYSAIGFEIQLPILVWGLDYIWYENKWNYSFIRRVLGSTEFRQNAYRILLTRGKEGVILYFPPVWKFNKTFELFKELGAKSITN